MKKDCGVIYIATGEKYVELAARSAQSLKKYCPDLPVHIFTECDIAPYEGFDGSTKITDPHFRSKVDYIFQTPYQRTLYLDADTQVCENIANMFDLLDRFDLALAHEPNRREERMKKYPGSIPFSYPPLNGGVILFKSTGPVLELLKDWKEAYHTEGSLGDQRTLRELIWLTNLKVAVLPPEYNIRYPYYIRMLGLNKITPKILHLDDFKRELEIFPKGYKMSLRRTIKKKIMDFFKRVPKI